MIGIVYLCIVLGIAGYGLWQTDSEYRYASLVMLVGSFGSTLAYAFTQGDWASGMPIILLIDAIAAFAFGTMALLSLRFWPLWMAGFQVGALSSHVAVYLSNDALPYAMGILQGFWAWFQLTVLIGVAVLRRTQSAVTKD